MLITAFFLAQLSVYTEIQAETALVLMDDLPAEIDRSTLAKLMDCLSSLSNQIILTGVESGDTYDIARNAGHVFHVKHGQVHQK